MEKQMKRKEKVLDLKIEELHLKQQVFSETESDLSKEALRNFETLNKEDETKLNSTIISKISSIYHLANTELKLTLDEIFPSYKIGNNLISLTRSKNPRLLIVTPKNNEKLIKYILELIHSKHMNSTERAFVAKKLINLGISKLIECDTYAFIAMLLNIDEKTLRRDLGNA